MASIVMRYYDSFLGTKKKKLNARPAGTKERLFTVQDEENVKRKLTNPNSFSPVILQQSRKTDNAISFSFLSVKGRFLKHSGKTNLVTFHQMAAKK